MMSRVGTQLLGALLGVTIASGCGRVGFEAVDDATSLDATRCDELTGVLFCEDFEGTLQLRTTTATPPSFVVTDDGTRSYRGARALHSHTTRPMEPAWILGAAMPYLMTGELHVRWYMFIPAEPATLHVAPLHLVEATAPFSGVIVGVRNTDLRLTFSESDIFADSPDSVPRDRWACFQLRIVIADSGGSVDVAVDGVTRTVIGSVDTLPPNGYRNIHAGSFATAQSVGTTDLWIDELIASTSLIPCD